jgi:hypothetical protein
MIGFLYQRSRLAGIAYNDANRLIESEEVEYTWDDNGNLLDLQME